VVSFSASEAYQKLVKRYRDLKAQWAQRVAPHSEQYVRPISHPFLHTVLKVEAGMNPIRLRILSHTLLPFRDFPIGLRTN
jgi:hypothetical protein